MGYTEKHTRQTTTASSPEAAPDAPTMLVKVTAVAVLLALAHPVHSFSTGSVGVGLGLKARGNALYAQQRIPRSWRLHATPLSMTSVQEKKTTEGGIGWDSHQVACQSIASETAAHVSLLPIQIPTPHILDPTF